ncbi:hypothetical protein BJP36_15340 [Moorena producens JHB]|uniref:Uncharacterized protein n=1 Tax=Moorena producens (strain JHB) TaxID=1454205 RepID=A0A1D9G0A4_MOOP1|nr:hypothetical protein [Moorena producens]AOY81068.1 hypothetical protein BJP36_15340 [Moorena producens JHB]
MNNSQFIDMLIKVLNAAIEQVKEVRYALGSDVSAQDYKSIGSLADGYQKINAQNLETDTGTSKFNQQITKTGTDKEGIDEVSPDPGSMPPGLEASSRLRMQNC